MLPGIKATISVVQKVIIIFVVFFAIINFFFYLMVDKRNTVPTDPIAESRKQIYANIKKQEADKTPEGKFSASVYRSYTCVFVGEACTDSPLQDNYHNSIVGKVSNLIALPYANPPASGVYWAYTSLQNAGFVPHTYAAEGIGFASIKPLIRVWKVMRDLAYILLVLVMVSIGFMVMFRMKLNPQTVISVESALPKIIMALLYITFSFPIAGFLIDLMYVLIVLIISVLSKADPSLFASQTQQQYLTAGFGQIWESMFPVEGLVSHVPIIGGLTTLFSLGSAIVGLLPMWINDSIRALSIVVFLPGIFRFITSNEGFGLKKIAAGLNGMTVVGTSLGNLIGDGVLGAVITGILFIIVFPLTLLYGAGWLVGILILFTMLLLLFRIFFMLLTGYLKILLLIVFSPIFMLFEAVPGRHAFSYWFKTLLTEILVFPVVIFLLVFGRVLVNIFSQNHGLVTSTLNASPLWQPPFLYGIDAKTFSMLLGMSMIFMIPEIVKVFREFMGVKGLPLNLQLGTFFAGAASGVGGGMGLMSQFHTLSYGVNALFGEQGREGSGLMNRLGGIFGKGVQEAGKETVPKP